MINRILLASSALVVSIFIGGCTDRGQPLLDMPDNRIRTDAALFAVVTTHQPFSQYALFPLVDSIASGTLNGSNAHQPLVRVSMNAIALGALQGGRLPQGASFPPGSLIFKEIRSGGSTLLYAILYKDPSNEFAANGWLWAEYHPDGSVAFSITDRGSGCVGCHSREQGLQHDLVRTFERQP